MLYNTVLIMTNLFLSLPVIFAGTSLIPPASASNYVPWTLVGFIFQYIIRRREFSWWTKYNYVLSAALDSGYAISVMIIFFALQYPKNGSIGSDGLLNWWGNTVYKKTDDFNYQPNLGLGSNAKFGPSAW